MLRDTLARSVSHCLFFILLTFPGSSTFFCASGAYAIDLQPTARIWNQVTRASWYGTELAGRPMAAGGRFNPERLTAAHRTLALGTWVKVTELRSNRAVIVQITDRGPYAGNRGLDLSYAAARQLGMVRRGVARVRIELLEEKTPPARAAQPAAIAVCKATPLLLTPIVEWRAAAAHSPERQRSEILS
jgi:rare lipoprotein A (peptidoglycan hydrolase)